VSSSGPDGQRAWLQVGAGALKHCVASGCISEATLLLEARSGHALFFARPGVTVRSTAAHTPNRSSLASAAAPHGANTGQPWHNRQASRRSPGWSDSQSSESVGSEQCGRWPAAAASMMAWVRRWDSAQPRREMATVVMGWVGSPRAQCAGQIVGSDRRQQVGGAWHALQERHCSI
jgi:hypothetical protein